MIDLAVVILTHDEEIHIERALRSVSAIAREVFVVDSFSRDRTVEIASALGAEVLRHPFQNYARQFQWALDNAPITAKWILRLDADEVIEPELAKEIAARLPPLADDVAGVNLKRRHVFLGRWIKHGGRYPLILLRIFRRGQGRIENRWMDEHMIVWGGETVTFENDFSDVNLNGLTFFTDKHNKYASREAVDVLIQKYRLDDSTDSLSVEGSGAQAAFKRWVKEKVYNRMPFWCGPLLYFSYRFVFQLGFLDGPEGIIYHFLQGFWYRFLVGAKIVEFERELRGLEDGEARLRALERTTGLRIRPPTAPS
jgi:glycosyltransferase involved in cell wall biosynthesis